MDSDGFKFEIAAGFISMLPIQEMKHVIVRRARDKS